MGHVHRRTAARALLAAGLAAAVPGTAFPATRAPDTVLRVATFPDLDRAAIAAAPRWRALHPAVELKLLSMQYADHHLSMTTALATGSGLPDVMAIDLRYIGKFAGSGGFLDLNQAPFHAAAHADEYVRFAMAQGAGPGGAQVAIPADIGPGTLIYRKDLLDRAGVSEAEITRDWSAYLAAGERIRKATGAYLMADAADLRDIALRQGLQDGEGLYFDAEGRVLVESARFRHAFELGRAARRAGLDARAIAWTNDWAAGFKQGRIATQMMGAWLVGQLRNWIAPGTAGLWRSAPLPGGVRAAYGGSFYAIPKKAANPAAAWDFIRLMTADPQVQLESLKVLDSFPALRSAHLDPVMDEPIAFLGGQRARQLWRETAARIPAIPVNRFDALATTVIRDEFERVVAKGKAIAEALADARFLIERRARRR
ncbi:extracellular solute-binding protein [Mitsuaria sp. GD03876]|uniref:ABC transporter substrate-binding protein n=1 Tax=Mitsuaria sp. GD03876 TaxID=2975399 RepID=UPI0024490A79|nr:extracellular solute-binding protein [Mitsuaria sp. GD03876]MDH0865408.1 extracellular solute-binding protein [Mitsuaria sp. GD03876]